RPAESLALAAAGARGDRRLAGAEPRSQAARLHLRRADDLLRLHAGDGAGERSPHVVLPLCRGGGPRRAVSDDLHGAPRQKRLEIEDEGDVNCGAWLLRRTAAASAAGGGFSEFRTRRGTPVPPRP